MLSILAGPAGSAPAAAAPAGVAPAPGVAAGAAPAAAAPAGAAPAAGGSTATPLRSTAGAPTGPAPAAAGAARPAPRFDFDGDGRDELVVFAAFSGLKAGLIVGYSGVPRREVVSPSSLTDPTYTFNSTFTAGDFDGDGFADLAVAGSRTVGSGSERTVCVYSGGPGGLDRAHADCLPVAGAATLVAGDLDGDGRDELAVGDGAPERDGPFRGAVTVLRGGADGLTVDGAQVVRQVLPRWPGLVEETFGGQLAIGDLTGDGHDDLVIGGTRRGETESDAHGVVTLVPGSAGGPDPTRASKLEGQLDTFLSLPVDVMTLADLNADGREDLVLGLPRYDDGEVMYLPGSAAGISLAGSRRIDQGTPGVPGEPDGDADGSHFGFSIATGDATGDGIPDLLVGAITDNVGEVSGAGSVTLIPGTPQGPTGAGSLRYTQDVPRTGVRRPDPSGPEPAEPEDYLGSAVALLDLDGTGPLEIFAEAKYEDTFTSGLLAQLRLQPPVPRRDGGPTAGPRLLPVEQYRPADLSGPGFDVLRLGYGLLGGAHPY
ncbi:VCBS repeat-containing protein [Micromonospora sp. NPDC049559]|uniref:VCBS repeat-containing protein n=1 Tax=Micromonospora sp. NPDC049559 TaxID=3155923 RepID=UPI0034125D42